MTKEQKIMRINGVIVAALGIVLAAAAWTPLYPLAKLFLNLAHWGLMPEGAESYAKGIFEHFERAQDHCLL